MASSRRVRALFGGAEVAPPDAARHSCALLCFRPERRARIGLARIEDLVALGPQLDLETVAGLGRALRVLRAARVAAPGELEDWVGRDAELLERLQRAAGAPLVLELRPRSRLRFTAWTDAGVETLEDVADVHESPDAWWVTRRHGRFPVRVPRDAVVRQRTDCERWYEVLDIQRG